MARLPRHGVAIASLNETEGTLSDVLVRLGFRKFKRSKEESLRASLGFAIGEWRMSGSSGTEPRITIGEVEDLLYRIAEGLHEANTVLGAVHEGFQHDLHIEVTTRVAQILSKSANRQTICEGYDAIEAFLELAWPIAASALLAAKRVRPTRGRQGRDRLEWYTQFVDIVARVCACNNVRPTLSTSRKTDEPGGRFLHAIEAFELLLPKHMRAPSRPARVQRLNRWRRKRKAVEMTKTSRR